MTTLIVFESLWGNTEKVARAIAAGLTEAGAVDVVAVGGAPAVPADDVDLLVVGGPTHTFSMSRPATRTEAVARGAGQASPEIGIREWLSALPPVDGDRRTATFDTRVDKVRHLPGSAARKAGKLLHHLGYRSVVAPESFYVADTDGPLLDGELARATAWGALLARSRRPHSERLT